MNLFERLAKLKPERYRVTEALGFPLLHDKDRTYVQNSIDDLILIAEELGAKIWAEPTGWRHEQMWKGKYTTEYSWDTKPRATQHEAYLAALEAVIAEKENQ